MWHVTDENRGGSNRVGLGNQFGGIKAGAGGGAGMTLGAARAGAVVGAGLRATGWVEGWVLELGMGGCCW